LGEGKKTLRGGVGRKRSTDKNGENEKIGKKLEIVVVLGRLSNPRKRK